MSCIQEKELVENYWHFGCHESELLNHGDYLKFQLGSYDVVLSNDSGKIICFDNICPHRGARIYDFDFGNGHIYCRYHGWSYKNGKVIIPDKENYPSCDNRDLNKFYIERCGSYIFFCLKPNRTLIEQLTPDLFSLIEDLSFDNGSRCDLNNYFFECYWPIAIENALEPVHLPFVHATTLDKLNLKDCKNIYFGNNSQAKFEIGNISLENKLKAILHLFNISETAHRGYMSIYLFPFGFISSTYGLSYSIQNFFPSIYNEKTFFSSRLYSGPIKKKEYENSLSNFFQSTANINRQVFDEDHEICKRITKNSWLMNKNENLSTNEIKIVKFRNALPRNSGC